MIRVVIADDHHLVRQGILALLARTEDIEVVGEAGDGHRAIEIVQSLEPDVLVMDITMPGMNGLEALRQLNAKGMTVRVVILSMHADEVLCREAVHHGASCFLVKGPDSDELPLAIRCAFRGGAYFSPAISNSVVSQGASHRSGSEDSARVPLTPKELEVLRLIADGHTNREIAAHLHISVKTVERHRTKVMTKLNAHNLVELIRAGVRTGLITLDG